MALFRDSWNLDLIAIIFGAFLLLYIFIKHKYSYWERKGFKTFPGTSYLFGHFTKAFQQKEHFGHLLQRIYDSTNEPIIGIYGILRPIIFIRDPELIQNVLVKDFSHFTDRGMHCNEEYDPLSGHLGTLPAGKWKPLRSKLTPAFTSIKLKAMFPTMLQSGLTLENYLNKVTNQTDLIDVHELSACYTTNVIASVGFGIDVDAVNDPNCEFRTCGRRIFEPTFLNSLRLGLSYFEPKLLSVFRIKYINPKVEDFLRSVVKQNLEQREKKHVSRKDFFQLLVQIRNGGTVHDDDKWETKIKDNENDKLLTENEVLAQTFIFFTAGYETSSTTQAFCLYELAKSPDIQQKVHDEIDRILEKHNGQITYESISEMKYLDSCLYETLRIYPILPVINRTCVKDYEIPGTKNVIEKDVQVLIPSLGLHMDEEYYEEPHKFNPNRFNEENSAGKSFVNRPYISFGEGPRNCIGVRLGKLQSKMGLVMMLRKFRYELTEELEKSGMIIDPKPFLYFPRGGIHLKVFRR